MSGPADDPVDAALRDLPRWDPPSDLGHRLAAAAARQHEARPSPRAASPAARLLELANRLVPWGVGSGIAAMTLAGLPWDTIVRHPAETGLLLSASTVAAGLWLTVRLLRS